VTTSRDGREANNDDHDDNVVVIIAAGGRQREAGKEGKICGADDVDDNDGDNNNGENDHQKINSKSTFYPPQSRKGTGTYSACILGIRLCYRCHGALVVKELKWA
jgi:hypothetical protein